MLQSKAKKTEEPEAVQPRETVRTLSLQEEQQLQYSTMERRPGARAFPKCLHSIQTDANSRVSVPTVACLCEVEGVCRLGCITMSEMTFV